MDLLPVNKRYNVEVNRKLVKLPLENGIYLSSPGRSPAHWRFSAQHSAEDIDLALEKMDPIFAKL